MTDKFCRTLLVSLTVWRVNASPLAREYSRTLLNSSPVGTFHRRNEERWLSCRLSRPLLVTSFLALTAVLPWQKRWLKYTTNYCIFLRFHLLKISYGKHTENGISEPLNFKILWGSMPPAPPRLELLWWSNVSSCAHNYKISCNAPVYSCTCKLSVWLFSFSSSLRPVAYSSSTLFCEEPSVCVSRVVWRQISRNQEILGIKWKVNVGTNWDT